MSARAAGLFLILLSAPAAAAERSPETLLPPTTQVFLRWDGIAAHERAYRASALGKVFLGGLGETARSVRAGTERAMKRQVVGDRLLSGAPAGALVRKHGQLTALFRLPELVARTGVVAGFEAHAVPPTADLLPALTRVALGKAALPSLLTPRVQFTFVLPDAGKQPETKDILTALAEASDSVEAVRLHGRDCYVLKGPVGMRAPESIPQATSSLGCGPAPEEPEGLRWLWWREGNHLVLVGALGEPADAVARVVTAGRGVTGHPLYAHVTKPSGFEVTTRGYIDGKSLAANWRLFLRDSPRERAWLADLGLFDVRAVRFWEGFAGDESRSVLEAEIASPRRGIHRLFVPKKFAVGDLPPLPADVHRWTAGRTNPGVVWDQFVGFFTVEAGLIEPGPDEDKAFAEAKEKAKREIDDALGVKLADLFDSLGDTFLTYYSPGDGLPGLGQVLAVSVADERKLTRAFDNFGRKLADATEGELKFRTREYHGATLREFAIPEGGSPVTVTYTIHKGWLVMALNPQPVQGFVLRSAGKLPRWKPDARTAKALAEVPPEAGLVQVVDPRPSVQLLFATAPLLGSLFGEELAFDAGDLPHAGAVTGPLFPNVAWTSFDGTTFRRESRDSLWLPFQEVGFEWLALLYGADLLLIP